MLTRRKSVTMLALFLVAPLVTACVTSGPSVRCGPLDKPIRLSPESIDALSEDEVKAVLERNEALEKKGCATPNR